MRLLFFDTETTGLDPNKHSVIEIGMIFYDNGNPLQTFHAVLGSEGPISLGALKVNKRTLDTLNSQNNKHKVDSLVKFLLSLPSDKSDPILFAGHNVSFDVAMLKKLLENYGYEELSQLFSHRVVDTATIGEFLRQTGHLNISSMSLSNLAKALDLETDKNALHSAVYDANLTMDCYFEMLNRVKGMVCQN